MKDFLRIITKTWAGVNITKDETDGPSKITNAFPNKTNNTKI